MKDISPLFKASLTLLVLCLVCFFFVNPGTPEFTVTVIAAGVNVVVLIACAVLMLTRRK